MKSDRVHRYFSTNIFLGLRLYQWCFFNFNSDIYYFIMSSIIFLLPHRCPVGYGWNTSAVFLLPHPGQHLFVFLSTETDYMN